MEREEFLTPEQRGAMKEGEVGTKLDIDFEALLEERDALRKKEILDFRTMIDMNKGECMGGLGEKYFKQGWTKVVERITKETKAFDELKETGIIYNLAQGIENGKYESLLTFIDKGDEKDIERAQKAVEEKIRQGNLEGSVKNNITLNSDSKPALETALAKTIEEMIKQGELRKVDSDSKIAFVAKLAEEKIRQENSGGFTIKEANSIFIKDQPPFKKEMWLSISNYGNFQGKNVEAIGVLDHELTHNLQSAKAKKVKSMFSSASIISGLFHPFKKSIREAEEKKQKQSYRALREIQAYKSDETAGFTEWTPSRLVKHLEEGYGFKDIDVLISGIVEIERLKALDLDDKEIGKLVGSANWDEKTATFPLFEKKIEELAKEKELDIEDVDNFVLARRLQREIEFEKARIIAQEELKKLAQETGHLT